jgi:membrane-bound lytic murein transglycosylase D
MEKTKKNTSFYQIINSFVILLLLFGSLFSAQVLAKTPKTLITHTGKSIAFTDTSHRLKRLLGRLGEPAWTNRELSRLARSVHAYLNAYTGRRYDKTLKVLQRGDRYRPMIRAKLARAKIPLAFEALAMAESAYRFNAKSHAGARGLWQYMPSSARHYGLHVGRKLDERTDPVLSTDAAIKYLKFLNKKFGKISVLFSVAAYNAGEGRIAGIIRKSGVKSKKRGYSHAMRYLPKETRGYVPEFLAAALVLDDPSHFGFPVSTKKTHSYVQVHEPLYVKKIAQIAKVSVTKIHQLNPELKKFRRIPSNNFIVRLPSKAASRLNSQLASKATLWTSVTNPISLASVNKKGERKKERLGSHSQFVYKVRQGNNLGGIANMFSVSIKELRKKNNVRNNNIQVGQSLIIPIKKRINRKSYRVKPGDSLGLIAMRLGVSIRHLKFVNGVTNPRRLKLGQKLVYYV